jgi:hypothetical protein
MNTYQDISSTKLFKDGLKDAPWREIFNLREAHDYQLSIAKPLKKRKTETQFILYNNKRIKRNLGKTYLLLRRKDIVTMY